MRIAVDQSPATPLLREGETLLSVTCGLLTQPAGKKDDATAEPKCHTLYDLTLEEQAIAEHVVTAVFRMSGGDSALVHISQVRPTDPHCCLVLQCIIGSVRRYIANYPCLRCISVCL